MPARPYPTGRERAGDAPSDRGTAANSPVAGISPEVGAAPYATYKPSTPPAGPWVYRKMIDPPRGAVPNGAYVTLRTRQGALIARGFLNRRSEIAFRIVAGPEDPDDVRVLFDQRLREALSLRTRVLRLPEISDAWRLVNAEGDRLSGLVVDRYGPTCVASVYSIGYIAAAEVLEGALLALPGVSRVLFRADERSQKLEQFHLPPLPPGLSETVRERGVRFRADLSSGHKTGLFLDQRDNRALLASLAGNRRMLDLCTNAGGFAIAAAVHGARSVTALDLDEAALEQARRNARLNKVAIDFVHADLFPWLRERHQAGGRFDLAVLDPPKLARTRADVSAALRTYRDMNLHAFRVLAPGAIFLTCSCSGPVGEEAFLETVRRAAREAGRTARILEIRGPAPDHPVALDFPEGRYLKAALLLVD